MIGQIIEKEVVGRGVLTAPSQSPQVQHARGALRTARPTLWFMACAPMQNVFHKIQEETVVEQTRLHFTLSVSPRSSG